MQVVYTGENAPKSYGQSIFLAGPTPRSADVLSWRPRALEILKEKGYGGVVFVPEWRDGQRTDYVGQVEWEDKYLNMADCIIFWVPREMKTMPALTTNTEWGVWQDSGKVVWGSPKEAEKVSYHLHYAHKLKVPVSDSLENTISDALKFIGDGISRTDGEREVPLYIWKTPHFQEWYLAQKKAGNRLDGARVVWTFRVGPEKRFVFFWALHVKVFIADENRHKTNEVVLSRPDIAMIVMYKREATIQETVIVLIREFRSPAATVDGYVWEIPGGSSFKPKGNPIELAAAECKEETGISIDPSRINRHNCRQMVATLSAHKAHLFSVELTAEEIESLKKQKGVAHGVIEDTERTYVEIMTLGEILRENKVDWSMLGMILSVVS